MVLVSADARSRIQPFGTVTCEIEQPGMPFNIPLGVPLPSLFSRKQLRFRARYKLTGVSFEDVREGIMFASYSDFMAMIMEEFDRGRRTRHFKANPFKKKLAEVLGSRFGNAGIRMTDAMADAMVAVLGPIEWHMREEPITDPARVTIHVDVTNDLFEGHFKFKISREADGVIVDDEWRPEGGGDVRTGWLPMANLVLMTHPLGFEQIVERAVEEILQAQHEGRPYVGQVGPPAVEHHDGPIGNVSMTEKDATSCRY